MSPRASAPTVPPTSAPLSILYGTVTCANPPGAVGEYTAIFPAMSVQFKVPTNTDRIVMGFQHVWRSVDSANNWTRIGGTACPTPSPSGNCGLYPHRVITSLYEAPSDSNYIYAVINYGEKVFKTTNANAGTGATWHDITRNLSDGISRVSSTQPTVTVYLAVNQHVTRPPTEAPPTGAEFVGPNSSSRCGSPSGRPDRILVATHPVSS